MTTFSEMARDLLWSTWVELGASGWDRRHQGWAIDPEPLIVYSPLVFRSDARLDDEAVDWCVLNGRSVSKARIRNLVGSAPVDVRSAFGTFAATVAEHSGPEWFGATTPRPHRPEAKSREPDLLRSSMAWLRMRAIFGLSTRTEILRYFLASGSVRLPAFAIAEGTGYRKRNVIDDCESMTQAGVLTTRRIRNTALYALARGDDLESFVGELPPIRPDWRRLLTVVAELVTAEERHLAASSPRVQAVLARESLDRLSNSLEWFDIDVRTPRPPADMWPTVRELGEQTLGRWARGEWDGPRFP